MVSTQPRVQRVRSEKPFIALLSAGLPVRIVGRRLGRSFIHAGEAGEAAGVPSPAPVRDLLGDGATPANRTLLGVTGVLGAEFADVGPVEALERR